MTSVRKAFDATSQSRKENHIKNLASLRLGVSVLVAMKRQNLWKGERGQALAETALFGMLAVIMAFGLLAWIPIHRARTAATAASYACAQFLSQSPNTARAAVNARQVAWRTLNTTWSATSNVQYRVQVAAPSGPGQPGECAVSFRAPTLFNGLLHLSRPGWGTEWFISRSETWKARWQ